MDTSLMLLGYTRAVVRFTGDQPAMDLGEALRLGLQNEGHPDVAELLRTTIGPGTPAESDLNEELPTVERYFALFEALSWAVSLDERLTKDWPFEEVSFGKYWCDDFVGGGLVRGLRYARNAVHHDWSLALDVNPEEAPFQQRVELLWLGWNPELSSKRPNSDGWRAYRENLAGRSVGDTLLEISALFEAGVRLARGESPRQRTGPAALKRFSGDRYTPEDELN
jgi:hypothetical protein